MSPTTLSSAQLVRRFWALYQARRWQDAEALLAPQTNCTWWSTRERFEGAAATVHVNAVYPEGWTIRLLELNELPDGRVHSLVRVDQDANAFYANGFFHVQAGLITDLQEYWSDVQAPPAWRRCLQAPLPGQQWLAPDERTGLSLAVDD